MAEAALSIHDLSVRYPGSDTDAVVHASIEVQQEKVVVVGANGCGKTSLLNAVLGLAPIRQGSVHVFGRDVRSIRGEVDVGTNLADVYRLMTVPVDGLIRIWSDLHGSSDATMRQWIQDFDLASILGRPLHRLSTGQTKLVGDLLALAYAPRLLLLDEPFDNVDFARRQKYLELLRRSNAAVLMNTHEFELLRAFPDWALYFMFEGQLVGRFRVGDLDRLYVSKGLRPGALASFRTAIGDVSVTLDHGDVPMKGSSNLNYLLERIA
jgi:ABC-type multidrug transport system ATPase subunit